MVKSILHVEANHPHAQLEHRQKLRHGLVFGVLLDAMSIEVAKIDAEAVTPGLLGDQKRPTDESRVAGRPQCP